MNLANIVLIMIAIILGIKLIAFLFCFVYDMVHVVQRSIWNAQIKKMVNKKHDTSASSKE